MCGACREAQRRRNRDRQAVARERSLCPKCCVRPRAEGYSLCGRCRGYYTTDGRRAAAQRVRRQLRLDALAAYGGCCACCGESEEVFLDLDHIDGGGAAHRRDIGASQLTRWLKQEGYPPGFQVLCRNCNWAKHRLGACPHEARRALAKAA